MARWCNGTGRGALDVAQRPVPLHFGSADFGIDGWWQIAERAVWPHGVVVVFPDRQSLADMTERNKQRLVEQFVAQSAVETLDEGILLITYRIFRTFRGGGFF